ncbi:MAG: ABC transporter permease [Planctomycetota bacterium]
MLALARRDLLHFFTTPLAWLVLAVWLALSNWVFYTFGLQAAREAGGSVRPLFMTSLGFGAQLLLVLAPAITMNAFAGERQGNTMPLLLSCPLSDWQLVGGKFLGSWVMLLSLLAATLFQPLALALLAEAGGLQLLGGYLGLALYLAVLAAIGNLISVLVDSPIAAYVISFGVFFVLQLFSVLAEHGQGFLAELGWIFGLGLRADAAIAGDLQLGHGLWLLSACGLALVLSHGVLRYRRLHG